MPGKGLVLTANGDSPVIISPDDLRSGLMLSQLVAQRGIAIDPMNNTNWGVLRFGDEVIVEDDGRIVSVNGFAAETIRARPSFIDDQVNRLEFPERELPIDFTGEVSLRELRAIAPVGLGAFLSIEGPAASGKTWTSQMLARSLLTAASQNAVLSQEKTVFIFLAIGERPPDLSKLRDVVGVPVEAGYLSSGEPFTDIRRELYYGFRTEDATLNAQIALERARRLVELGYQVIFFIDSVWMLVLTLGGVVLNGSGGLAASGIPREALKFVKDNFFFTGQIPGGGSMTLVTTCLYEGPKTSSETVINEIGAPNATARWHHLLLNGSEPRPWIDIGSFRSVVTKTREIGAMLRGDRLKAHEAVEVWMADMEPRRRRTALRRFFATRPFDPADVLTRLKVEERSEGHRLGRDPFQAIVNLAPELGKITDPKQAAQAVLVMLSNAWKEMTKAEMVKRLIDALEPADRQKLGQLLKAIHLTEETPLERLLAAATELRGQADVLAVVQQFLIAIGADPHQLMASIEGGPVEEILKISAKLGEKENGGQSFGRATAQELVKAGYTPDQVFDLLKGGRNSPKMLRRLVEETSYTTEEIHQLLMSGKSVHELLSGKKT